METFCVETNIWGYLFPAERCVFSRSEFWKVQLVTSPKTQLSNVQNPVDIPLYWLVDRDPYNGLL